MTQFDLKDKTILVTGASSGIGKQCATMLAESGAKCVITGRTPEKLDDTFNQLAGSGHIKVVADLTDERGIIELINSFSDIDGMVHSAGISPMVPVRFIQPAQIKEVFALNFEAALLIVSKALAQKKINKNASLVFISSLATTNPLFGGALYCSSKMALEGLSKTLAIELSPKGIRSNCVNPAYVFSPMVDKARETMSAEFIDKFKAMHPNGFGYPADVANVILMLLANESKWINGQNINLGAFNINIPSL